MGSGYSVDIVEKPLPRPKKVSLNDYAFSMFHVSMRVWGLAYDKVYVNATVEPLVLHGHHFTEGGLVCERMKGAEDVYVCRGSGYIYKPLGFMEEYVAGSVKTMHYYSGWIIVLLYSIHQAVFTACILAPVVAGLCSYCLARLGLRGRAYAASAAAGIVALALGGLEGLETVPKRVPGLEAQLSVFIAAAALAAPAAQLAAYKLALRGAKNKAQG